MACGLACKIPLCGFSNLSPLTRRISYCTVDKLHDKVFAYISQNTLNGTLECHAYLCSKRKLVSSITKIKWPQIWMHCCLPCLAYCHFKCLFLWLLEPARSSMFHVLYVHRKSFQNCLVTHIMYDSSFSWSLLAECDCGRLSCSHQQHSISKRCLLFSRLRQWPWQSPRPSQLPLNYGI